MGAIGAAIAAAVAAAAAEQPVAPAPAPSQSAAAAAMRKAVSSYTGTTTAPQWGAVEQTLIEAVPAPPAPVPISEFVEPGISRPSSPDPFDPLRLASLVFPPLGLITMLPPGGEKVLKVLPKAAIETIFPPASWITGQPGWVTLQQAEQERQISIIPEYFLPEEQKQEIRTTLKGMTPQLPGLPELPKMPDILGGMKNTLIIVAVAIGGLFILSRFIGGKK